MGGFVKTPMAVDKVSDGIVLAMAIVVALLVVVPSDHDLKSKRCAPNSSTYTTSNTSTI
jgi:hypothetical protein